MGHLAWRNKSSGIMSAEFRSYRLTVQEIDNASRTARFLVFRQGINGSPDMLVSSKTEPSVHAAIDTAERLAIKLAEEGNGSG